MKFDSLTKEQLELLKDTTKTGQEICKILNCGIVTVSRWRKKLDVDCKVGCKKGKTKPWTLLSLPRSDTRHLQPSSPLRCE